MSQDKCKGRRLLFLCGVARSGTSALVRLVNTSPDVFVGMERYYHLVEQRRLGPELFEPERFSDIRPGDTHEAGGFYGLERSQVLSKMQHAKVVGDKYPLLFRYYDYIFDVFPDASLLYIIRNPLSVAESYQKRAEDASDRHWSRNRGAVAAVKEWNASVRATYGLIRRLRTEGRAAQVGVFAYETLFSQETQVQRIFSFLRVTEGVRERVGLLLDQFGDISEKFVKRREDIRLHVAVAADWEVYRALIRVSNGKE